jgi:hypothetical protein
VIVPLRGNVANGRRHRSASSVWSGDVGVAITGVLLSVLISVLLVIVADQQAILGVAIGGIGTVVSLQLGMMVQLRRRTEHEDQTSRLLASAERVPSLLPELTEIAEAASVALSDAEWPIYRDAAASELSEAKTVLQGLAHGQIEVSSRDNIALLSMIKATKQSVVAVTVFPGQRDFWESERGKAYVDMNRELTRRSSRRSSPVKITRYFVVDEQKTMADEELGKALRRIVDDQLDAGVHVWHADAAQIDSELYTPVLVIDGSVVQEVVSNARGDALRYRYSTNPADVQRALRQIRLVGAEARRASKRSTAAQLSAVDADAVPTSGRPSAAPGSA